MNVVIFVAGLPGTGKSSIAKCLAEKYSIHYYDIDEVKKVIYPQDPDFEYNMRHGIPFKEETRLKVFEQVMVDFKQLAKKCHHLVVDEALHLKRSRQVLFDGAKAYFGGYVVVWVKTDEALVEARLRNKNRKNHILKDPEKMYPAFAKDFERFDESYIVCENNGSLEETTQRCTDLMKDLYTEDMAGSSIAFP